MTRARELLWTVTLTCIVASLPRPARADDALPEDTSDGSAAALTREPDDTLEEFVDRSGPPGATLESLKASNGNWGRSGTVVAFYRLGPDGEQQGSEPDHLAAYVFVPGRSRSRYIRALVGTCPWEGGAPTLEAAFFAAAGPLRRTKLVVICTWPVRHYDVYGTLYATYVYDPPARDASGAVVVRGGESKTLSGGCDCEWRTGEKRKAQYTTERAVRAALRAQR